MENNRTEESETEDESEPTARGMSGSSLTSYPTSRTSKRRKVTSTQTNKAATSGTSTLVKKMGFADKPMHGQFADDSYEEDDGRVSWHKVYLRGLQMRRNIVDANFEGWRIYANTQVPVTRLIPDLDINADVKQVHQ